MVSLSHRPLREGLFPRRRPAHRGGGFAPPTPPHADSGASPHVVQRAGSINVRFQIVRSLKLKMVSMNHRVALMYLRVKARPEVCYPDTLKLNPKVNE